MARIFARPGAVRRGVSDLGPGAVAPARRLIYPPGNGSSRNPTLGVAARESVGSPVMSRRFRFARVWARVEILVGVLVILLGVALAAIALRIDPEAPLAALAGGRGRAITAVAVGVAGLLVGGPLIVFGQLTLVVIEMRDRLARIDRRARRRAHGRREAAEPRGANRLLPR